MLGEGEGVFDLLDGLFAHARERGEGAVGDGFVEGGDVGDAGLLPEGADGFGAEAGDVEECEEALGDAGAEVVELCDAAGGAELGDLVGHFGADAGEGEEALAVGGESGEVFGVVLDEAGGAGVGGTAEGVFAQQVHQAGDFIEGAGERGVDGHRADGSCVAGVGGRVSRGCGLWRSC